MKSWNVVNIIKSAVALVWGLALFIVVVVMIVDVRRELKRGMLHASPATRKSESITIFFLNSLNTDHQIDLTDIHSVLSRFQERAVFALTMQVSDSFVTDSNEHI